jgi:hypothetical protein
LLVQQPQPCERQAGEQNREQRRQNTPRAPFVERKDRKAAFADLVDQDAGDQIARDDEEDIDTDKTARKGRESGMEENDGKHGNRPQTVDFGPVTHHLTSDSTQPL